MPRGRPPKPTKLHQIHGTFRKDRHGDRIDAPRAEIDEMTLMWRTWLRLPDGPPTPRQLDPLEEILERDGIEVTDEDRVPQAKKGS